MSKTLAFQWLALIGDSQTSTASYQEEKLTIGCVYTKVPLAPVADVAKGVEKLEGVQVTLEAEYDSVLIDGLTTPIQLTECVDTYDFDITGEAPSLAWLLEHTAEINSPNASRVFYVGSMVVYFSKQGDSEGTDLGILDVEVVNTFVDEAAGMHIQWLGSTFDEFLGDYGYMDAGVVKEASYALTVYKALKALGFKDPKGIATHFGDKRLIADLVLKGVFEGIGKY